MDLAAVTYVPAPPSAIGLTAYSTGRPGTRSTVYHPTPGRNSVMERFVATVIPENPAISRPGFARFANWRLAQGAPYETRHGKKYLVYEGMFDKPRSPDVKGYVLFPRDGNGPVYFRYATESQLTLWDEVTTLRPPWIRRLFSDGENLTIDILELIGRLLQQP